MVRRSQGAAVGQQDAIAVTGAEGAQWPASVVSQGSSAHGSRAPRRGRRARSLAPLVLILASLFFVFEDASRDSSSSSMSPLAFVSATFAKKAGPSLGVLILGLALYFSGKEGTTGETCGILCIYFGCQTGMNLYMKGVLSTVVVDADEGLKGIPMGFLLTAIQQFVAFAVFGSFLLVGSIFQGGYQVKKLTTRREYIAVLCFSVSFALNIGLNNFSLSLVAISINLIIRSCLPLSTALSQLLVASLLGKDVTVPSLIEWVLMIAGVTCAAIATYAKNQGSGGAGDSAAMVLGVIVCTASIFSGAINMVLAQVLGTSMKLNPIDTTCYMALPAGIVLMLPALIVPHPMGKWPGFDDMTDWQVFTEVLQRNPRALTPVFFSGVLAFVYNIIQYGLVHKLSAAYATFAGNFNKAATVALSLIVGLEHLPDGSYGYVFLAAVVGNILAFTMYSALKKTKKS